MIRVHGPGHPVKYAEYDVSTSEELYDLLSDPAEMTSEHANPGYAGVRNYLRRYLGLLKDCGGAGCATLEDTP